MNIAKKPKYVVGLPEAITNHTLQERQVPRTLLLFCYATIRVKSDHLTDRGLKDMDFWPTLSDYEFNREIIWTSSYTLLGEQGIGVRQRRESNSVV